MVWLINKYPPLQVLIGVFVSVYPAGTYPLQPVLDVRFKVGIMTSYNDVFQPHIHVCSKTSVFQLAYNIFTSSYKLAGIM